MFNFQSFPDNIEFVNQLIRFTKAFPCACILNSNGHNDKYSRFGFIAGLGVQEQIWVESINVFDFLKEFHQTHQEWMFGFLSYDIKNQLENLSSIHPDRIHFPLAHFFIPQILIYQKDNEVFIGIHQNAWGVKTHEGIYNSILSFSEHNALYVNKPEIRHNMSKEEYFNKFASIKDHIQKGDIYEMNFCMEFFAENCFIDPFESCIRLNTISPAPFSAFYRLPEHYLICSSPERFMQKNGDTIISQPIKGTARRGTSPEKDEEIKTGLLNNLKERSENVMIVDLVRNDLSYTALKDTVKVEELFGIYSFAQVHQMISTITSKIKPGSYFTDVIRHAFPMGSMTGAPKIRAMQIVEDYEITKRGLYSGSVGYISPEGDFDFNVVIRSIQYNQSLQCLSFMTGSAITSLANAEDEYQECLLKANAMVRIFEE